LSESEPRRSSVSRGSAAVLAQQVLLNLGQFGAVVVLAHALGPSGRGAVAFVVSTSLLVGQVLRLGLTSATTYMVARLPASAPKLLANGLLFSCLSSSLASAATLGVLLSAPTLHPRQVGTAALIALCLGIVAGDIAAVSGALLMGTHRFVAYAASSSATGWLYAGTTAVAFVIWGLDPSSACLIWGLTTLAGALLMLGCGLWRTPLGRPDLELFRDTLRFGIRGAAGELAITTNARADQSIMGAISSSRELGLYAVAVNVGEVLLYLPNAVGNALMPNLVGSEQAELERTTLRAFRLVFGITAVAVAGAAVTGWFLIPIVFGERFGDSVAPFLLLLPGALGYAAQKVFSSALIGLGKPGRSSLGPLTALITGLALDVALIPSYGGRGAAAAASIAFIAGGLVSLLAFRAMLPFPLRALVPTRSDARVVTDAVRARRDGERAQVDRPL
jgi:O-antigen/teichoic acid export membrane protein